MTASVERRHLLRSFRNRNYRLYFGGQLLSASGTFMQLVAQAWLVLSLGGDGVSLGLLTSFQFLPAVLLFGPVGVLLERVDRRRIFLATQVLGCMEAAGLGLLVVTGHATLAWAFAFAGIRGCVAAVEIPVRSALVFDLVGPDDLANGTGLTMALQNASRVVGPALAGLVIAGVGVGACFLINAGSFVAAIVAVLAMRTAELHLGEGVPRQPRQIREGLRYVRRQPEILGILVMAAVFFGLGWEHEVILPLAASEQFDGGAGTYALLTSALGIGSIAGGVAAATATLVSDRSVLVAAVGTAGTMVAVAAAPTIGLTVAALVLMGAFGTLFMSLCSARLQLTALPSFRGRVVVLWTVAALGTRPVGGPIIGWIVEHRGPQEAFVASAASVVLLAVPLWRWIVRRRRTLAGPAIHTYTEQ